MQLLDVRPCHMATAAELEADRLSLGIIGALFSTIPQCSIRTEPPAGDVVLDFGDPPQNLPACGRLSNPGGASSFAAKPGGHCRSMRTLTISDLSSAKQQTFLIPWSTGQIWRTCSTVSGVAAARARLRVPDKWAGDVRRPEASCCSTKNMAGGQQRGLALALSMV